MKLLRGLLAVLCVIQGVCGFSSLHAMKRGYGGCHDFCLEHMYLHEELEKERADFLLIPPSKWQCDGFTCSKCGEGYVYWVWASEQFWFTGDPDEDDFMYQETSCDCGGRYGFPLSTWIECSNHAIYEGYLDFRFITYFCLFREYLNYVKENQDCSCYWPETSEYAKAINNFSYGLFKDLFKTTALSCLVEDDDKQEAFLQAGDGRLSTHGVSICCVAHSFFYSDYSYIIDDLDKYSKAHFSISEYVQIAIKLENILNQLRPLFLEIYSVCLDQHEHERIRVEKELIEAELQLCPPLWTEHDQPEHQTQQFGFCSWHAHFEETSDSFFRDFNEDGSHEHIDHLKSKCGKSEPGSLSKYFQCLRSQRENRPERVISNAHLTRGIVCSDYQLYDLALQSFNQAIACDRSNVDVYKERLIVYFELGEIDLAIEDYKMVKQLEPSQPPFRISLGLDLGQLEDRSIENPIAYSQGLVYGAVEGLETGVNEFVPTTLECFRAISQGLWSYVCPPEDVSSEVVKTTAEVGERISLSTMDVIGLVIPEIGDLHQNWQYLSDYDKGRKIGFIIGRYGIEIFGPVYGTKMVKSYRAFKRANAALTVEQSMSTVKRARILAESAKRLALREKIIEQAIQKGKILIKDKNVQYHVMQKKHAWDRLVKLTGNIDKDFNRVIALLEEHSILKGEMHLVEVGGRATQGIDILEFNKKINGIEVKSFFTHYIEEDKFILNNAWVVTK